VLNLNIFIIDEGNRGNKKPALFSEVLIIL
jgi:hypothetical protein